MSFSYLKERPLARVRQPRHQSTAAQRRIYISRVMSSQSQARTRQQLQCSGKDPREPGEKRNRSVCQNHPISSQKCQTRKDPSVYADSMATHELLHPSLKTHRIARASPIDVASSSHNTIVRRTGHRLQWKSDLGMFIILAAALVNLGRDLIPIAKTLDSRTGVRSAKC